MGRKRDNEQQGDDQFAADLQAGDERTDEQRQTDDQAALERLKTQAAAAETQVLQGQTTTTTPDSVTGERAETSDGPGELDKLTVEERLERVRGWAKNRRTNPPMSADWSDLDAILGSRDAGAVRRP